MQEVNSNLIMLYFKLGKIVSENKQYGNNFTKQVPRVIQKLKNNQPKVKKELKINESSINLIDIDDPRMAHESFISDSEIVKVELDNTKYNGDKYNILLSHRPELVVITLYNK